MFRMMTTTLAAAAIAFAAPALAQSAPQRASTADDAQAHEPRRAPECCAQMHARMRGETHGDHASGEPSSNDALDYAPSREASPGDPHAKSFVGAGG